ncbi:hypothetical protein LTR37_005918 [Vermiconidia calcicola]|uniref:Uncharacterized protein n=1 Tax=Vermiconidia calcicola TaxID=1690605 RepID=A0ACC3NI32_9PEZI|nr:hypothetical protein LTR37_005918 [Vermiconidia calcicola]
MYVFDPDIAKQVAQDNNTPKHRSESEFMYHLSGPGSLVALEGAQWKKWRSIFNPGFQASHLMTLTSLIVDEAIIFVEKLGEHADKGEVFRLEEDATRLTVDIIGKVALEVDLGTQRGEHEMVTAFREQVHLLPNEGMSDPFKMYYPSGIYRRWRNMRIMKGYIGNVLEERFARQDQRSNSEKKERKRAIVDLAIEAYREQSTEIEQTKASTGLNQEFKQAAITQMLTFVFAGHDTTSTTICYATYELQRHPECLARLRKEHDDILGSVEDTPQVIRDQPHILNKLEYTMCVIRETLRLWAPASTPRTGYPGLVLRDPKTGESLPTENPLLLWVVHYAQHRSPEIWGDSAETFDPSRFLPENAAKLRENAWRPFEKGPRNCIGQDLSLIEARVILALVVRRFAFRAAFDSLDELKNDGSFYAKDEGWRKGKQDIDGEQAYPILLGAAKPREGMPVRVKKV